MNKPLLSLLFILLTFAALDTQARGGGQGRGGNSDAMQGQSMGQGGTGNMDRERTHQRQQNPGQNQDGTQQQRREMNQKQNQIHQTAPATNIAPAQ